jgi:hypothetical protein
MNSSITSMPQQRISVGKAILWGGLIASVLDATDGVVAYYIANGSNPIQVLQYIASGMLGPDSFKGGLATAGLGALLHFFIGFTVAAVYVLASQKLTALAQKPAVFGLLYGAAVYFFMNYVVLPYSAVPTGPFSLGLFINGVIGHALFVGLPIAYYASRAAQPAQQEGGR